MPPVHYAGSIAAEDTLVRGAAIDCSLPSSPDEAFRERGEFKNPTALMYLVVLGSPEQTVQETD
jgi:hypothetical protein